MTRNILKDEKFNIFEIEKELQEFAKALPAIEEEEEDIEEEDHLDGAQNDQDGAEEGMGDIPDSPEIEASTDGLYWIAAHTAAMFEHIDPLLTGGAKMDSDPSEKARALFTKSMAKGEFKPPSEAWLRCGN